MRNLIGHNADEIKDIFGENKNVIIKEIYNIHKPYLCKRIIMQRIIQDENGEYIEITISGFPNAITE
jgi:hypothetical protein